MTAPSTEPLEVAVIAADGARLAEAGDGVTPEVLAEVARRGRRARFPAVTVGALPLWNDLDAVTREELYAVVFSDRGRVDQALSALGELRIPAPVADELAAMKAADEYTYRHVAMTTVLTARMLQDLGWPETRVLRGASAALTHDFGKLRVPAAVLRKATALTAAEARLLRQHPTIGHLLLHYYLGRDGINAQVALAHHERPDGTGYPLRRKLSDRLVRVVAVNDIFDALISPRPYRKRAFDIRGALEFLWAEVRVGRVDETACRLLVSYNRQDKPDPWTLSVSGEVRASPPEENAYGRIAGS